MSSGIYFVILAILARENCAGRSDFCRNGGKLSGGVCVCPPEYTGTHCDVDINSDDVNSTSLEKCFYNNPFLGSGSASGSGDENEECENPDQIQIKNVCQLFSAFHGSVTWNKSIILQGRNMTSSFGGFTIQRGSKCALRRIFRDLLVGDILIENVTSDKSEISVAFVVKTAVSVSSSELNSYLKYSKTNSGDVILRFHSEDYDECDNGDHHCHPVAMCVNQDGGYSCECPTNYTALSADEKRSGSLCRHICKDEFGRSYCHNGGACSVTIDRAPVCECPQEYSGHRCERHWAIYFYVTIGLAASFGLCIVIFVVVILMLRLRPSISTDVKFQAELKERLKNGRRNGNKKRRGVKEISNPYASTDEGVTVATKANCEERFNSSDEEVRL